MSGRDGASSTGASQIHSLETKFDEAYTQSLAVKDERILQLEQRVEETTRENQSLRTDVSSLRKELIQSQARRVVSPGHSPMGRYMYIHVEQYNVCVGCFLLEKVE